MYPFFSVSPITRFYYYYYYYYYYREAYTRQAGFSFFYIFFSTFPSSYIYTLLPNHTIPRSLFLSPFQKYYVPFFLFFGLLFFPACMLGYR